MTPPSAHADTEPHARAVASRPVPPSSVRLGSLPANSEEDLRFVQDRLALLLKTTFIISATFLVVTSAADIVSEVRRFSSIGRASHLAGSLLALGLWGVTRSSRNLSPRMLQALDMVGTLGTCWAFASMGHHAAQPYGSYTGLLAITHVSVSRAMIVPSIPQRTLLLAAASFASVLVSRALLPWPVELALTAGPRSRAIVEGLLWSAAGCAVATVASKVIYGLQEKAREARQLGQYVLEAKIGEGGMGEVYRARHAMLRRPTAVKLLSGDGSEQQLRRFEKEVQLTARLTHPNTISVYDYGRTPDGIFYYAMELLDGLTLEQLVEKHGPQPAGRVIHLLLQVCGALSEAHGIGLIHRDIKPANMYLCRRGDIPDFVKVLDFGLVREINDSAELTHSSSNAIVGTPLYLSPEAILTPDGIDERADIYALGCAAYFLVTGAPPFLGASAVEVCAHHLHTPPEPPSRRRPVPEDLELLIMACLAKDRTERPQSARALAQGLERCSDRSAWSESDAQAWWVSAPSSQQRRSASSPSDIRLPQRTICCADLEERLRQKARTA